MLRGRRSHPAPRRPAGADGRRGRERQGRQHRQAQPGHPPRRRPPAGLRLVPRHPAERRACTATSGAGRVEFRAGAFRGRLPSVRRTVARFGAPEVCEFRKGWFADTMPALRRAASTSPCSTSTCSARPAPASSHLVPRLRPGGVDLHAGRPPARRSSTLLGDARFWRDEVGVEPPRIAGPRAPEAARDRRRRAA